MIILIYILPLVNISASQKQKKTMKGNDKIKH